MPGIGARVPIRQVEEFRKVGATWPEGSVQVLCLAIPVRIGRCSCRRSGHGGRAVVAGRGDGAGCDRPVARLFLGGHGSELHQSECRGLGHAQPERDEPERRPVGGDLAQRAESKRHAVHLRSEHFGTECPDAHAATGRRRPAAAPPGSGPSRPCAAWGTAISGGGPRCAQPPRRRDRAPGAQHRGFRVPWVLRNSRQGRLVSRLRAP